MTDRLREALAGWDGMDIDEGLEPERTFATAARVLVDAPEVWWCEVHEASAPDWIVLSPLGPKCWRYVGVHTVDELPDQPCRMVPRLLVDPGSLT